MRMSDIRPGMILAHSEARDAHPSTDGLASFQRVAVIEANVMRGDKQYDPEVHSKYTLADAHAGKADEEQERKRAFTRRADGVRVVQCDAQGNPATKRHAVRDDEGIPTGEVVERVSEPFVVRSRELKMTWAEAEREAEKGAEAAKHAAEELAKAQEERAERQRAFAQKAESLLGDLSILLTRHAVEDGERILKTAQTATIKRGPQGIVDIDGWPVLVVSQSTARDHGIQQVTGLRPDTPDAVLVAAWLDVLAIPHAEDAA